MKYLCNLSAKQGMRLEHVKELMGYEKLKTTMRYTKVEEEKAFGSYRGFFDV